MPDLMTRDELVAYLVDFSDRHQASAGETMQFFLELVEELTKTEPESIVSAARSLSLIVHARNDAVHSHEFAHRSLEQLAVLAEPGSGKTHIFISFLSEWEKRFDAQREEFADIAPRGYGIGRGLITIAPDFDDPLPADIQKAFEN